MKYPLILVILVACACHTSPPCSYEVPSGIVRADNQEDARMIAIMAERYTQQICTMLEVEVRPNFLIFYDDNALVTGVRVWRDAHGKVCERRIELGAESKNLMHFLLPHELTHWYAKGIWTKLPHTLEEGLADFVALQLEPGFVDERLLAYEKVLEGISAAKIDHLLRLNIKQWHAQDEDDKRRSYAIGYRFFAELGLDGIRKLCQDAHVAGHEKIPADWLTERYGLRQAKPRDGFRR